MAFLVCGYLADSIIYSNDLASLLGTMALFFAYVLLFYRGTFMEKSSVLLVFYPALIAINYLMLDMGGRMFLLVTQASYEEAIYSPELALISTAIHTFSLFLRLLFWIGAWLILRRFLSKIPSHLNTRTWLIIDMLILASFVAIFTIIYFMPEDTAIVYPICGASIFSSFGCMYLAAYIYDSMQNAYRIQQMESQRDYYKGRIAEEERVRSIYHDLKNHLLVMESRPNMEETHRMAEKLPEDERLITVRADRVRDMLIIVVENNASPGNRLTEGTTKKDRFVHGFGIPNIRKAVEKYGGQCSFRQEGRACRLKIMIPFP